MSLSRLFILAVVIYGVVWVLILPPVDRIQDAVEGEEIVADVDPDIQITQEEIFGEEAFLIPVDEEDPNALPDGERRIRIEVPEPAPRSGGQDDKAADRKALREQRRAQANQQRNSRKAAATGGLPLGTFNIKVDELPEGPRPRVRLRPDSDDARIAERLKAWASTAQLPRIEDLFGELGQAVSTEGELSVRVPANVPWVLDLSTGRKGSGGSLSLAALQPGEVRAQAVSLSSLEPSSAPSAEPSDQRQARGETKSRRPRQGTPQEASGARKNKGKRKRDAATDDSVARLTITAIGGDDKATRMWIRIDPGQGMDELREPILEWARGQEGAQIEAFEGGYTHRKRGALDLIVPPRIPLDVTFGADGQLHGKIPILPMLPGERQTLAVALVGSDEAAGQETEVAARPERVEVRQPLEQVEVPTLQPGEDLGGRPLHSSRRGEERLREPVPPPPSPARPGVDGDAW